MSQEIIKAECTFCKELREVASVNQLKRDGWKRVEAKPFRNEVRSFFRSHLGWCGLCSLRFRVEE